MIVYRKIGLYLFMVAVLLGSYKLTYSRGYDKATVDVALKSAEKILEASNESVRKAEIEIEKIKETNRILLEAERNKIIENRIVDVQIQEVIRNVEKIKYVNSCGTLSNDSVRLLNKAIDKVNNASKD